MTPTDRRYTPSHQWVKDEGGILVVGLTDHAQRALGQLTLVELPAAGRHVRRGEVCAVVESVKAASEIEAPLDGEITEVNEGLGVDPTLGNQDPYDRGWLWKMRPDDPGALSTLLTAEQYQSLTGD